MQTTSGSIEPSGVATERPPSIESPSGRPISHGDFELALPLAILGAAAGLGIAGDLLLRATPWGLNAPGWLLTAIGVLLLLRRIRREPLQGAQPALIASVLLFSFAIAWRDEPALKALDIFVVLAGLALLTEHGCRTWASLTHAVFADCLAAGVRFLESIAHGPIPDVLAIALRVKEKRGNWTLQSAGAVRGLIAAVPLLVLFGALLASADAVFSLRLRALFNVDFAAAFLHVLFTAICAWVVAGYLRNFLAAEEEALRESNVASGKTPVKTPLEVILPLTALDLLFAAFVIIQIRYLFGGAELLEQASGITYAEYARRGFFELAAVIALCLPLLCFANWLLRLHSPGARRVFHALAWVMILLLMVIAASALFRMALYREACGLTRLRLYVTAFMIWLVVVLLVFGATVLRGRRHGFLAVVYATGLFAILTLHVLNPGALIARTNIARLMEGKTLDVNYLTFLSDDAVPAMLDALPGLPPPLALEVRQNLEDRLIAITSSSADLRTWSIARARACKALKTARNSRESVQARIPELGAAE